MNDNTRNGTGGAPSGGAPSEVSSDAPSGGSPSGAPSEVPSPPDMPSGGSPPGAPQSLLDRIRGINTLLAAALALVPVAAFVAYAVFQNAREKVLLEASGRMEAAFIAYDEGDTDGSLEILGEVRERFGDTKTAGLAEYYEGVILFREGEDELALETMSGFLAGSPDRLLRRETLFMSGFSSYRLGRWADAIGYFEELVVESPAHRGRVLPLLSAAYKNNGDEETAERLRGEFENALPKAPEPLPEATEAVSESTDTPPEETADGPPETETP